MTMLGRAVLLATLATACGGSASETPPPLEPLPAYARRDRSAPAVAPASADAKRERLLPEWREPKHEAPATWGAPSSSPPSEDAESIPPLR